MDYSDKKPAASAAGTGSEHHHKNPSNSELLSSAKLVAEAAKAALHGQTDKIDKARVADAAADILGATSHYGNLEGKGVGKYMDQAGNYLHQYHTSHSTTTVTDDSGRKTTTSTTTTTAAHTAKPIPTDDDDDDKHSGSGGFGGYMKMAGDILKKH